MRFALIILTLLLSTFQVSKIYASSKPSAFIEEIAVLTQKIIQNEDGGEAADKFTSRFDIPSFAKRCLVDHWQVLTAEQRTEFINAFSRVLHNRLRNSYMKYAQGRSFSYAVGQTKSIAGGVFAVPIKVSIDNVKIKITFYLKANDQSYRLIDYETEGILLSRNYRGQFNYLIRKYGFDGMLDRIRHKALLLAKK